MKSGNFFSAAKRGYTDVIRNAITTGQNVNERIGDLKIAALHIAANNNQTSVCRFLLENGADVNLYDGKYRTPLYYAVIKGYHEIVRILIEYGANVKMAGFSYDEPLALASNYNNTEIVITLVQNCKEITNLDLAQLLKRAVCFRNQKLIKFLIDKGADPNKRIDSVWSIMELAVMEEWPEIVVLLKDLGGKICCFPEPIALRVVKIYRPDDTDYVQRKLEILKIILTWGFDVNIMCGWPNNKRLICMCKHPDVIKILREHGAKANCEIGMKCGAFCDIEKCCIRKNLSVAPISP